MHFQPILHFALLACQGYHLISSLDAISGGSPRDGDDFGAQFSVLYKGFGHELLMEF